MDKKKRKKAVRGESFGYNAVNTYYYSLHRENLPANTVPRDITVPTRSIKAYNEILKRYVPNFDIINRKLSYRIYKQRWDSGYYDTMDKWLHDYAKLSHKDRARDGKVKLRRAKILKDDGLVYYIKVDSKGYISYKRASA